MTIRAASLLALLVALVVGCGKSDGTIAGAVTYQGKPVYLGTIAFVHENGRVISAGIAKGRYQSPPVPLGPVKITVQSHHPAPQMLPPGEAGAANSAIQITPPSHVDVPSSYADPVASGLTYLVQPGSQEHNLALE